jgi:hypothetical protein
LETTSLSILAGQRQSLSKTGWNKIKLIDNDPKYLEETFAVLIEELIRKNMIQECDANKYKVTSEPVQ